MPRAAGDHPLVFRQSNFEGELVGWIHEAIDADAGIVINPAGLTFTSIPVLDALKMSPGPIIELHISNIHRREAIYHKSLVSTVATASSPAWAPEATRSPSGASASCWRTGLDPIATQHDASQKRARWLRRPAQAPSPGSGRPRSCRCPLRGWMPGSRWRSRRSERQCRVDPPCVHVFTCGQMAISLISLGMNSRGNQILNKDCEEAIPLQRRMRREPATQDLPGGGRPVPPAGSRRKRRGRSAVTERRPWTAEARRARASAGAMTDYILTLRCDNRPGIVAAVASRLPRTAATSPRRSSSTTR